MSKGWAKIHSVNENRFQVRGSPYLFIHPKATEAQKLMLLYAANSNFMVQIHIKRMVGNIAVVKHFKVDRYKAKMKSHTRYIVAHAENDRNMIEKTNNKRKMTSKGHDTTGK